MSSLSHFITRRIWPRVSAHSLGARLPDYLKNRVAEELGLQEEPIELERVRGGANTVVRRWVTSREGVLFLRAWPWNPAKRRARGHRVASELLSKAGLATPRILFSDDSFATMRRWRLEAVVEKASGGLPLDPKSSDFQDSMAEVARQLARLHAVQGPQWGSPWRPSNAFVNPRVYWADRLRKFELRINPETSGLSGAQIDRGLAQLRDRLLAVALRQPSLIHGDVGFGHVFVAPENKITWIDFGTVRYGVPEQDLADVRMNMCDAAGFERFLAAYRRHGQEEKAIDTGAIITFRLLALWERLNSRIQKRRHRRERRAETPGSEQRMEQLEGEQSKIETALLGAIADPNSLS